MTSPALIWRCDGCEHEEPVLEDYTEGDWEPCTFCENGTARVKRAPAAELEQPAPVDVPPPSNVIPISRDSSRSRRKREVRAKVWSGKRATKRELAIGRLLNPPANVEKPGTRDECKGGARPCPFVSCRHHLYLDVTASDGIKLNFPDLEVWDLEESCVLDVADRGGATLEEVGEILNLTRERIRQIEVHGLSRLAAKRSVQALGADLDEGPDGKRHLPVLTGAGEEIPRVRAPLRALAAPPAPSSVYGEPAAFYVPRPDRPAIDTTSAIARLIVHRDVKPQNVVFFAHDREPKTGSHEPPPAAEKEAEMAKGLELTELQELLIGCVRTLTKKNGRAPTLRELAEASGIESTSDLGLRQRVANNLKPLRGKLIEISRGSTAAVTLLDGSAPLPETDDAPPAARAAKPTRAAAPSPAKKPKKKATMAVAVPTTVNVNVGSASTGDVPVADYVAARRARLRAELARLDQLERLSTEAG